MAKQGPPQSNAERRISTRRRLLDAASTVVARHGYHQASVSEIAREAGFSTGALYAHFASKEELFTELIDEHVARQMQRYAGAAQGGDPGERAEQAAGQWMEHLDHSPEYFSVFISFWDYATREPRLREHLAERFGELRGLVTDLIERGAAEQGVPLEDDAANRLAIFVIALGNGIALERMVNPGAVPDDYFGSMVGEVLGALAAQADREAAAAVPQGSPG
jgi:AcrR family transcriptional regulator